METKPNENSNDSGVMNLQIQYFPRAAKEAFDEVAKRNKISKRELFTILADNLPLIEEFLTKKKILVPRT